jgi:ribosomal protein S4
MIKTDINKLSLLKLYKRDLLGRIILKRKLLTILKFLKKVYKIKKRYNNSANKKNTNFFRILNIPRPVYTRRKTKFGKYFFLRQQFRIFYGFLRIRTLQLIIKKSFKKMNSINYFLYLMESRLDVILYRLNFVSSVRMARQLIVHGNVVINKRTIRNPNYNMKKKDILTFNNKDISKYKLLLFYNIISNL